MCARRGSKEDVTTFVLPLHHQLFTHDSAMVRVSACEVLVPLANRDESREYVATTLKMAAKDTGPSVRCAVAKLFAQVFTTSLNTHLDGFNQFLSVLSGAGSRH